MMRYRNIHTGEVKYWEQREAPDGSIVMVPADGSCPWALNGIGETPPFLLHHVPADAVAEALRAQEAGR